MIAVSDTGPIHYLLLIDSLPILPRLFERVVLPNAVREELQHPNTPDRVRKWAYDLPAWIEVQSAPDADRFLPLHPGEREAIALAGGIKADVLLLDERKARQIARKHGLTVIGTLGLLGEASARNWIELSEAFRRLRETNFHVDPKLLEVLLEQSLERKR